MDSYLAFIYFFILLFILYFCIFRRNIENFVFKKQNSQVIVYIIALLDNPERLQNIKNNLLNVYNNYPTFIFPAINGKELTEEERRYFIEKGYFTPDYFTKWNKGQQGCALSHLLLLNDIAKNGDPSKYYIIVEDDTLVDHNFEKTLEKIIKESQNIDWNQIILHNNKELGVYPNKFHNKKGFLKKCSECVGAVGYMVTKNNAQIILKKILPLKWPVDEDIRFNIDKQYGMDEPIIHQGKKIKSSMSR